jgi:hypothetical protein
MYIVEMVHIVAKRETVNQNMNDRFSGLRESINRDKKHKEKQLKNDRKKSKNNNNQFRKSNQSKFKEVKIDHSEANFPSLNDNSNSKIIVVTENYLEKTKKN